jgi:N-glycosidase YbiA
MYQVLKTKTLQHDEVMEALINSGDALIAENSPVDYFWGLGADGTGQNHLGKVWMTIRAEVMAIPPES